MVTYQLFYYEGEELETKLPKAFDSIDNMVEWIIRNEIPATILWTAEYDHIEDEVLSTYCSQYYIDNL